MLDIGTKAPDFELPDQNGEVHKLSDYLGKKEFYIFIQRITRQAVQNRHVVFQSVILNLPRKVR